MMYEGKLFKLNNKYECQIVTLSLEEQLEEIIKHKSFSDENSAMIWIDDELFKLITGKGIWE